MGSSDAGTVSMDIFLLCVILQWQFDWQCLFSPFEGPVVAVPDEKIMMGCLGKQSETILLNTESQHNIKHINFISITKQDCPVIVTFKLYYAADFAVLTCGVGGG